MRKKRREGEEREEGKEMRRSRKNANIKELESSPLFGACSAIFAWP